MDIVMEPFMKKGKSKLCIVHSDGFSSYINLKDVNEGNENRFRAAHNKREQLGSNTYHKKQRDMIPDAINNEFHGVHMEPCCNKFTIILAGNSNSSR